MLEPAVLRGKLKHMTFGSSFFTHNGHAVWPTDNCLFRHIEEEARLDDANNTAHSCVYMLWISYAVGKSTIQNDVAVLCDESTARQLPNPYRCSEGFQAFAYRSCSKGGNFNRDGNMLTQLGHLLGDVPNDDEAV